MSTRRTRLAAVGLIAALFSALTPSVVSALDDVDHPVEKQTVAEARNEDIGIIAATYGWSRSDTRRHMKDQDEFGALLVELSGAFPETYASGEFAESPGGPSIVRFKGAVPSGVGAIVAEHEISVDVRGGLKENAKQLRNRTTQIRRYLVRKGWRDVVSSAMADGSIEVTVRPNDAGQLPTLPRFIGAEVIISSFTGPLTETYHARGGALVTGSSSCTTGFSVTSFGGINGVTTAGHCVGANTYNPPPVENAPTFTLSQRGQHRGIWGDVEWKSSSHVEPAEYYSDVDTTRDVTSVEAYAAIATNNVYCFYGRFSNNRQCDDVRSTYVDANFDGYYTASLVSMDNNRAIPGDSGGPVSYGTEAAGSVVGAVWNWFSYRDVWSVADLYSVALGVYVKTV